MSTTVVSDTAVAIVSKEQHLIFPGISSQWPAMTENYRLTCAPILVINLGSIFRGNERHRTLSLILLCSRFDQLILISLRPNIRASSENAPGPNAPMAAAITTCLLYTSDAADERS